MTIIEKIKSGNITKELLLAARKEKISEQELAALIPEGKIVSIKNIISKREIVLVGKNIRTKVNANIGTSPDAVNLKKELKKLETAINAGADAVMDLSTGGNVDFIRKQICDASTIPVGTVPIYQAVCEVTARGKEVRDLAPTQFFEIIEKHAQDGVDFFTVHCGVTKHNLEILKRNKRVCGIVSRGGAFMAEWVLRSGRENPLYEYFEDLLKIAKKYDVVLSLGDGLRPGSIADANDEAQIAELKTLCFLAEKANKEGVQVILEGPGHMPLNAITEHVELQKKLSNGKPYYLLGPLVTDIAAGYDHINSAIGAAIASAAGADLICYVTPAEHIRLPDEKDVYEGIIAARIAAHAGDIVKGIKGAKEKDLEMSVARKNLDWKKQIELALDPDKVKKEREKLPPQDTKLCTMCGKFCAMKESTKLGI